MPRHKTVVITSGDPAGCGPAIVTEAVRTCHLPQVRLVVVGDRSVFEKIGVFKKIQSRAMFVDAHTAGVQSVKKGYASKVGGKASLNYLRIALDLMQVHNIKRLVTAPLSKEAVQKVQASFSGHTEFLADYFGVTVVAMMMVSKSLRVALLSRHIALGHVGRYLKKPDIVETLSLVCSFLQGQCAIRSPRVVVASVNPHAGCLTFLGKEERKIVAALKACKYPIAGPYPADTLFTPDNLKKYDCIVCSYHDQAMIPFKLLSFYDGVNVTLGLPIIRTSPAHGVAYELMRLNQHPCALSMKAALQLALRLRPPAAT